MPLEAENEAMPSALNGFDNPIIGKRARDQPASKSFDCLVMRRVHFQALPSDNRVKPRAM